MSESINNWTHSWAKKNNLLSHYQPKITSTNEDAKKNGSGSFQLYLTDQQTHGRGRGQNKWNQSHSGDCLLSTWCFVGNAPQPVFAARVGLCLYRSLYSTWPVESLSLKAPNDIYFKDGKLAGLLIEVSQKTSTDCRFFIGLGLNVFSAPNLDEQKTSALSDFAKIDLSSWELFCQTFYNELLAIQSNCDRPQLQLTECEELLTALNKHPDYKYKEVKKDGSLINSDGSSKHWTEL